MQANLVQSTNTGLITASTKEPHIALLDWALKISTARKTLPNFEEYPRAYPPKVLFSEYTLYQQSVKSVHNLMCLFETRINKLIKQNHQAVVPINPKAMKKWRRYSIGISALTEAISIHLRNNEWIPDPDIGEETTPAYEEVRGDLKAIQQATWALYLDLKKEAQRITLELQRRRRMPQPPVKKKKSNTSVRKTYIEQLNEWQLKNLPRFLGIRSTDSLEDALNDATQLGFDSSKFKAKRQQILLPSSEDWGIISYTIILNAWISSVAVQKLQKSPYEFEPEYVGGSTHNAIGLKSTYEPGFWYLREGLLLGTPHSVATHENLKIFIEALSKMDDDYRFIFSKVVPWYNPIFRKRHKYWLLLPTAIDLSLNTWDIAN